MSNFDVHEWRRREQEEKERLQRRLPSNVIKDIPLSYLKKVGHLLEIPQYASLNKRQLIEQILYTQKKYQDIDVIYYDTILFFEKEDGVCCTLEVNENCKFYPYIMNSKKYK